MFKRDRAMLGSVFALFLFLAAAGGPAYAQKIYKLQWMPASHDAFILVRVVLQGGQSRLFALDTGAPETLIDRKAAHDLHLTTVKTVQESTGATSEFAVSSANFGPDAFALPEVHLGLVDLSVMQRLCPELAGFIGMDLLAKYSLRMDYSKKQVELIPGSVKGTPNEPTSAARVPLHPSAGVYKLAGSLDGVKIQFTLDTGSRHTFVSDSEVLKSLKPQVTLGEIKTVGFARSGLETKEMSAHMMRLQELAFGKFKVEHPFIERGGFDFEASGLGTDTLRRFRILADFKARTLYLTPDPAFYEELREGAVIAGSPQFRPAGTSQQTGLPPGLIRIVPFETLPAQPLPFVSLSLDGGKPHLFLVDPAISNCLLDADFVRSEKLTIRTLKTETEEEVGAVVPTRIAFQTLLPFSVEKVPFGVQDLSSLRSQSDLDVVGILGANLLRVFIERIDFSKKTIAFFIRSDFAIPGKQAHRVPLQTEEGHYYLKAKVDDNPARFRLSFTYPDTILQDVSLLSTLKPAAKLQKLTADGTGSQTLRLHSLSVEDLTWDRPVVDHSFNTDEQNNQLSLDFFARFYLTLDLGAKQLYLEPDPDYKEDLTKWLGTGFSSQTSIDGKMNVSEILVPSPASEAGVMVGDKILEINGLPIATTPLVTIFGTLKHVEGGVFKVKIQCKGEGKPREFTLTIRTLL